LPFPSAKKQSKEPEQAKSLPFIPSAKAKDDLINIDEISRKSKGNSSKDEIQWTGTAKDPSWRVGFVFKKINRINTNIPELDEVFGGLPRGIVIFFGEHGTGKSQLAKVISLHCDGKVLYFCTESGDDVPRNKLKEQPKNVEMVNYISFLPEAFKVQEQIEFLILKYKPLIVIIDSLTTIFSNTKKAVAEADVRTPVWMLAKKLEELNQSGEINCSLIGISQTRSKGQYLHPAGGEAILFAGSMNVFFEKKTIDASWDEKAYGKPKGSVIYLMTVQKDRQGVAKQDSQYRIEYDPNDRTQPFLVRVAQ
jgi:SpoVK/Ycf46/Vps4 family AAA+-type ATPase